jgi:hypothetical protein
MVYTLHYSRQDQAQGDWQLQASKHITGLQVTWRGFRRTDCKQLPINALKIQLQDTAACRGAMATSCAARLV